MKTLTGHTLTVMTIIQLRNGMIASGSCDNSIKLWDANNGSLLSTLTYHTNFVRSFAETSAGQLVSGSEDNKIAFWKNELLFFYQITTHLAYIYLT